MALDFAALKGKLNSFNRTPRDENLWKPKEGKNIIRIVPSKETPANPFVELHFHYLGNKTYLSPLSYGNRDPIAEFADGLKSDPNRDPKERWAEARPFMPKLRTYTTIIVRGEEEKGVRFYSFGQTVYKEILSYINDPDYGDITDPTTGRDIVLEYTDKKNSDTNFAKTSIKVKPAVSALGTKEQMKVWMETQPDLRAMYVEPSYNELKSVLAAYLDPEASVIPSAQASSVPESKTAAAAAPKKEVVKSAVDEFDSLFNNED